MGSISQNPRAPNATQRLRELLSNPNEIVVAPGVHDGISARIALSLGFDAIYMASHLAALFGLWCRLLLTLDHD